MEREIEPYGKTLNKMSSKEIRKWADCVIVQIKKEADPKEDEFMVFTYRKYNKCLQPHILTIKFP